MVESEIDLGSIITLDGVLPELRPPKQGRTWMSQWAKLAEPTAITRFLTITILDFKELLPGTLPAILEMTI